MVKQGKSEWINEVIAHNIRVGGAPIACAKFEEAPKKSAKRFAGKLDGTVYHKPDSEYDPATLAKTIDSLDGKVIMFGQPKGMPADWDMVKEWIRFVVVEFGVKDIILDPITRITNQLDSSETETLLRKFADEISSMAQELGFFYIVTCHLKAPTQGTPHERGGKVQSNQFRGSRAMMEACYQMLGIERNRDPELPIEERNTSRFVLLEEREYGNVGSFEVTYDPETMGYLQHDKPMVTEYMPEGYEEECARKPLPEEETEDEEEEIIEEFVPEEKTDNENKLTENLNSLIKDKPKKEPKKEPKKSKWGAKNQPPKESKILAMLRNKNKE